MKHLKKGRKFSRTKDQREALIKIMLGDLLIKKRISTTLAKAKELKILADKLIGQIKDTRKRRFVKSKLPKNISLKILGEITSATASRKSGFTRVIRKERRRSDSAQLAFIEIIEDKTPET